MFFPPPPQPSGAAEQRVYATYSDVSHPGQASLNTPTPLLAQPLISSVTCLVLPIIYLLMLSSKQSPVFISYAISSMCCFVFSWLSCSAVGERTRDHPHKGIQMEQRSSQPASCLHTTGSSRLVTAPSKQHTHTYSLTHSLVSIEVSVCSRTSNTAIDIYVR